MTSISKIKKSEDTVLSDIGILSEKALDLLRQIVAIPAPSSHESKRCQFLYKWVKKFLKESALSHKASCSRSGNNILLYAPRGGKKSLLMCAHMDTVPPCLGYTTQPFRLTRKGDRYIGLGSNDDGASIVCMLMAFSKAAGSDKGCGLLLSLTSQEETGGEGGLQMVLENLKNSQSLPYPDFALVGEPTGMKAAIAERGLLVLDGEATGSSSHASEDNPDNAIYKAMADIKAITSTRFGKRSEMMGPVHLAVTQINAGKVHNMVPDQCRYVVDIRPNDRYTNLEIWQKLQARIQGTLTPRRLDHKVSVTPGNHLLMKAVKSLNIKTYVSATSSDWSKLDIPAVKIGPGDSSRSHSADEYITEKEIYTGIKNYLAIIKAIDNGI